MSAPKGRKIPAQGIALGMQSFVYVFALKGRNKLSAARSFRPFRACFHFSDRPQGDALGYIVSAFQALVRPRLMSGTPVGVLNSMSTQGVSLGRS